MAELVSIETIEMLWHRFSSANAAGEEVMTIEGLWQALQAVDHETGSEELRGIFDDADAESGLREHQFVAALASLQGDALSRLRVAFDVFDENGDGRITQDELRDVLVHFGMSKSESAEMFDEGDQDGDGALDFEAFCSLMPEAHERAAHDYRDTLTTTPGAWSSKAAPPPAGAVTPGAAASHHARAEPGQGTSRLQMQIGLLRLLQGAAYRSFRENCAANYETHLRAKTLPYTIPHFVAFAEKTIALYKALDVVDPVCFPVLDAVTESLGDELTRLKRRIANWGSIDKTPQMLATAEAMQTERSQIASARRTFAAGVELALTLRKKGLSPADAAAGALESHERNRLRALDLRGEMPPPAPEHAGASAADYLKAWNHVLLESEEEEIDGAMMPAAYWYEDFMPKLLAACSVGSAEDVTPNTVPDEAALDRWFRRTQAAGELHPFGGAVATHFAQCRPEQKLEIRQAWRLTRHYLNGVEKRRERLEFGRGTGFLSQYVAFLDVYLDRSDVRDRQMRLSFPYYIGPAVWRFLHTAAEIVCGRDEEEQREVIGLFKDFFRLFATMYACPYCRYHLNRYVVRNREVEMYPLEYLMLGCAPEQHGFDVSIDDKLAAITDGSSLRLFLWKLHNAVSASIARTESWFHLDDSAFYTTRHWPSLDAELARAHALGEDKVPVDGLMRICALLKPIGRLATVRWELKRELEKGNADDLADVTNEARAAVRDLEEAMSAGAFLERAYRFDPALVDEAPHFTPEEEAFGRSGLFVEA
jgi:Ca2+-binding EF-hand superfamily protein